jgi:hypothetical protein
MSQITIRDLSPAVEAHLRERVRIEGQSLSKVAAELLAEATGLRDGPSFKKRDLSRFSGSWSAEEARAFEATQKSFESIDEDMWK